MEESEEPEKGPKLSDFLASGNIEKAISEYLKLTQNVDDDVDLSRDSELKEALYRAGETLREKEQQVQHLEDLLTRRSQWLDNIRATLLQEIMRLKSTPEGRGDVSVISWDFLESLVSTELTNLAGKQDKKQVDDMKSAETVEAVLRKLKATISSQKKTLEVKHHKEMTRKDRELRDFQTALKKERDAHAKELIYVQAAADMKFQAAEEKWKKELEETQEKLQHKLDTETTKLLSESDEKHNQTATALTQVQAQSTSLQNKLKSVQDMLHRATDKNSKKEQELSTQNLKIEQLLIEVDKLRGEVEIANQDRDNWMERAKHEERDLEMKSILIDEKEKLIKSLRKEVRDLKDQLNQVSSQLSDSQRSIKDLETRIGSGSGVKSPPPPPPITEDPDPDQSFSESPPVAESTPTSKFSDRWTQTDAVRLGRGRRMSESEDASNGEVDVGQLNKLLRNVAHNVLSCAQHMYQTSLDDSHSALTAQQTNKRVGSLAWKCAFERVEKRVEQFAEKSRDFVRYLESATVLPELFHLDDLEPFPSMEDDSLQSEYGSFRRSPSRTPLKSVPSQRGLSLSMPAPRPGSAPPSSRTDYTRSPSPDRYPDTDPEYFGEEFESHIPQNVLAPSPSPPPKLTFEQETKSLNETEKNFFGTIYFPSASSSGLNSSTSSTSLSADGGPRSRFKGPTTSSTGDDSRQRRNMGLLKAAAHLVGTGHNRSGSTQSVGSPVSSSAGTMTSTTNDRASYGGGGGGSSSVGVPTGQRQVVSGTAGAVQRPTANNGNSNGGGGGGGGSTWTMPKTSSTTTTSSNQHVPNPKHGHQTSQQHLPNSGGQVGPQLPHTSGVTNRNDNHLHSGGYSDTPSVVLPPRASTSQGSYGGGDWSGIATPPNGKVWFGEDEDGLFSRKGSVTSISSISPFNQHSLDPFSKQAQTDARKSRKHSASSTSTSHSHQHPPPPPRSKSAMDGSTMPPRPSGSGPPSRSVSRGSDHGTAGKSESSAFHHNNALLGRKGSVQSVLPTRTGEHDFTGDHHVVSPPAHESGNSAAVAPVRSHAVDSQFVAIAVDVGAPPIAQPEKIKKSEVVPSGGSGTLPKAVSADVLYTMSSLGGGSVKQQLTQPTGGGGNSPTIDPVTSQVALSTIGLSGSGVPMKPRSKSPTMFDSFSPSASHDTHSDSPSLDFGQQSLQSHNPGGTLRRGPAAPSAHVRSTSPVDSNLDLTVQPTANAPPRAAMFPPIHSIGPGDNVTVNSPTLPRSFDSALSIDYGRDSPIPARASSILSDYHHSGSGSGGGPMKRGRGTSLLHGEVLMGSTVSSGASHPFSEVSSSHSDHSNAGSNSDGRSSAIGLYKMIKQMGGPPNTHKGPSSLPHL